MRKVFIGGPIQYALKGHYFNPTIKEILEKVISEVESSGFQVFSAHRTEGYGEMDVTDMESVICIRDFNWMKACDIFVAVLPSLDNESHSVRTDGTCVELGWSSVLGKKVILIKSKSVKYSHLIEGLGAINANLVKVDIADIISGSLRISELIGDMLNVNVAV
jgi:nucleoside 2-deoxyribosyltransferase